MATANHADPSATGDGVVRLHQKSAMSRDSRRQAAFTASERENLARLAAEMVASWPPLNDDERGRLRNLLGRDNIDSAARAA